MQDIDDGALERELARALTAVEPASLPPQVIRKAKLAILDSFGVLAGAAKSSAVGEVTRAIDAWESGGSATLLLEGRRVSPPSAAFANGTAAHALDFDDQHDPARIHTLCTVLPAALAAAEDQGGVSGMELLCAVVTGAELSARLGLCCPRSLEHGCHPTAALGSIAAAAAAGKVWGLDESAMLAALSIAFVQMGGTPQSNADGALTKRMGAGFAARNGVFAAHLARHGLSGPHRFLTGAAGLFKVHQRSDVRPEELRDWFSRWEIANLSLKPFPCCRASHAALQVALEWHSEGLRPAAVEAVSIGLGKVNHLMVGAPFSPEGKNPTVHGQFNLAYGFLEALSSGRIGLESFDASRVLATDRTTAGRIACHVDPAIDPDSVAGVNVTARLRDGRTLHRSRTTVKGSPEEPMSEQETVAKFQDCVRAGTGMRANRFADLVLSLEHVASVEQLIRAFPRATPNEEYRKP